MTSLTLLYPPLNAMIATKQWTREEEAYAQRLIHEFELGTISDCANGTTLRAFLASKLNCAPMRISKKYAGMAIGKHVFARKEQNLSQSQLLFPKTSEMEQSFLHSCQKKTNMTLNPGRNGIISGCGSSSTAGTSAKFTGKVNATISGVESIRNEPSANLSWTPHRNAGANFDVHQVLEQAKYHYRPRYENMSEKSKLDMHNLYSNYQAAVAGNINAGTSQTFSWSDSHISPSSLHPIQQYQVSLRNKFNGPVQSESPPKAVSEPLKSSIDNTGESTVDAVDIKGPAGYLDGIAICESTNKVPSGAGDGAHAKPSSEQVEKTHRHDLQADIYQQHREGLRQGFLMQKELTASGSSSYTHPALKKHVPQDMQASSQDKAKKRKAENKESANNPEPAKAAKKAGRDEGRSSGESTSGTTAAGSSNALPASVVTDSSENATSSSDGSGSDNEVTSSGGGGSTGDNNSDHDHTDQNSNDGSRGDPTEVS